MKYVFTLQLIKYLNNLEKPELIINFIYKNLYQLIKEKIYYNKNKKVISLDYLQFIYGYYYKNKIINSDQKWLKTIFPPFIIGYKNFYRGIAGRLAFFSEGSLELDAQKQRLVKAVNAGNKTLRNLIWAYIPEKYYWYGDPRDWSMCYWVKEVSNGELQIEMKQIVVVEEQKQCHIIDKYGLHYTNIILIFIQHPDYDETDIIPPFAIPLRHSYYYDIWEDNLNFMIEDYKNCVTGEYGYSEELNKKWEKYRKNLPLLDTNPNTEIETLYLSEKESKYLKEIKKADMAYLSNERYRVFVLNESVFEE